MTQITFGNYKPRSSKIAPKLSLDKEEQARISFVETAPTVVFVHSFEKIVTGRDGKPIEEVDEWPDGTPRKSYKTEYFGKFACLGDFETVDSAGVDPENCAACRAAVDHPNAVKKPTRRFLGHVIKYATKPGAWTLTNPFSASLIVWDLTENRFNQINDIYEEHGDLSQKDLLLGPCENKQMQKYSIQAGNGKAKYLESEENTKYVITLLENERVEDLASVAAKKPLPYELEKKVSEIVRAYNKAMGVSQESSYESLLGDDNTDDVADEEDSTPRKRMTATPPKAEEEDPDEDGPIISDEEDEDEDEDEEFDATKSLEELLRGFKS